MVDPSIAALQAQLAGLQNRQNLNAPEPIPLVSPAVPSAIPSGDDIRSLIKSVLAEEIAALKGSPVAEPIPVVKQPVQEIRDMSLKEAIGNALTLEEQTWLSNLERLKALDVQLPRFLQTEDGKAFIKSFLTYFKGNVQ